MEGGGGECRRMGGVVLNDWEWWVVVGSGGQWWGEVKNEGERWE